MNEGFILIKKFLDDKTIECYIDLSNKYNETDSKIGNRVGKEKKIRKDIFFNKDDSILLDNIVFTSKKDIIKDKFDIDLKYRENYKLGTYYGDVKGFYVPHTDTQGYAHRKISFVVCLSNKENYKGGIFKFVDLDKGFKFDKGDAVFFRSDLLHGVQPVTDGKRQVIISFMWDEEGEKKRNTPRPVTVYIPNLTDIDYSDSIIHTWNDKNDYMFENNNSDVLFITFAGLGMKNSLPTFIFHNYLKKYKTIDKLFLRDIKCKYYLTGLKNSTKNIQETVDLIRTLTNVKKYKKIVALGCSAGGFAAILFGNILKFTKVIAFSPQTVINNHKLSIVKDTNHAPKTCKYLTNYSQDFFYQKCLNLKSFIPFTTNVDIHYSNMALNGVDKRHAEYIKHDKCKLIEYNSNNHILALELRDSGKLKSIIENEFNKLPTL